VFKKVLILGDLKGKQGFSIKAIQNEPAYSQTLRNTQTALMLNHKIITC
jgi:hypothetical protein